MKVKKYNNGGVYPGGGVLPRVHNPTDRQLRRMTRRAYRRGGTDDVLNMLNQAYTPPNLEEGEVVMSGDELRSLNRASAALPAMAAMGPLITAYQQAKMASDPANTYDPSLQPGPLAGLLQRLFGMTQ